MLCPGKPDIASRFPALSVKVVVSDPVRSYPSRSALSGSILAALRAGT